MKDDKETRRRLARYVAWLSKQITELRRLEAWSGNSIATDATQAGLRNELYQSLDGFMSLILGDSRQLVTELIHSCKSARITGLVQLLLNGYSGDALRYVRATGAAKSMDLPDPRLAVVLGLQTDLGTELFATPGFAGSGLSSRLMSFYFNELNEPHRAPEPALAEAWKQLVVRVGTPPENGSPVQCGIDPEAVQDLRECFSAFRGLAAENRSNQLRAGFWARAGEQLQRLCLVRALMEPPSDRWPHVTVEIVDSAKILLGHAAVHLERGIGLAVKATVPDADVELLRLAIDAASGELRIDELKKHDLTESQVERILKAYPQEFARRSKRKVGKSSGRPAHIIVKL